MKDFSKSTAFLFHKIVSYLDFHSNRILQDKYELSFFQFLILILVKEKKEFSQVKIARHLNCTEASVSRQVEILRQWKLIERKVNPENRRENLLFLTQKGLNTLEEMCLELDKEAENMFFSCLKSKDRIQLSKILIDLSKSIDNLKSKCKLD